MRIVHIERRDYKIAYTVRDGTDPEIEIQWRRNGLTPTARTSSTIAIQRDLDLNVKAEMIGGETDKPDLKLPHDPPQVAEMNAHQTHADSSTDRRDGIHMQHMKVDEDWRREGIGAFLFDVYRAAAVWLGERASGKIGTDGGTMEFLNQQGIPMGDLKETKGTYSGPTAIFWNTDADNLHYYDRNVVIEERDPQTVE